MHPSSNIELNAAANEPGRDRLEASKELVAQQDMRDMNTDLIRTF